MRTIFDWLEFKDIADELSEKMSEAYARVSIILYYYAVFSAIREYLIKIKKQYQFINNSNVYERVWKFLMSSKDYNENEVGEFLNKVRHVRNSANYDKEHDYEYFTDKLVEIHKNIDNVVNSIVFLRNNPNWEI